MHYQEVIKGRDVATEFNLGQICLIQYDRDSEPNMATLIAAGYSLFVLMNHDEDNVRFGWLPDDLKELRGVHKNIFILQAALVEFCKTHNRPPRDGEDVLFEVQPTGNFLPDHAFNIHPIRKGR